jgi:predicted nucleotidyltransferase
MSMAIQLAPDLEASIRQRLEDGNFRNENDVVREALLLLDLRESQRRKDRAGKLKPSEALALHREAVRRVFKGKQVSNPRVFGSVVRGEDHIESDLDILVDPTPKTSLFDLAALERELEELLGMPVDVLTPKFLPEKDRERVVAEAQAI